MTFMMFILLTQLFGCTNRMSNIPKLNIAGNAPKGSTFSVEDYTMADGNLDATDSYWTIIILPLPGTNQKLVYGMIDNAVRKICDKNGYDFMTNVKIYQSQWYIPLLFGKTTVKVVGEGWTKTARGELKDELQQLGLVLDENGGKL